MTIPDTDPRTAYTTGLRQLADILDDNPDLPLPYTGTDSSLNWIEVTRENNEIRDAARLFARLVPGTIVKKPRDDAFDLIGHIAGVKVCFIASRDAVCTRVVTGTHEVTIAATPAMPATEAQPAVTQNVETVEWICSSLLADAEAVA